MYIYIDIYIYIFIYVKKPEEIDNDTINRYFKE